MFTRHTQSANSVSRVKVILPPVPLIILSHTLRFRSFPLLQNNSAHFRLTEKLHALPGNSPRGGAKRSRDTTQPPISVFAFFTPGSKILDCLILLTDWLSKHFENTSCVRKHAARRETQVFNQRAHSSAEALVLKGALQHRAVRPNSRQRGPKRRRFSVVSIN